MPANRTKILSYICDYPDCASVFPTSDQLRRHQLSHTPYEQRHYACEFIECKFHSNSPLGLKIHINSVHLKIRVPCKLGCGKTFCSPGAECTHRKRCHPESFAPYSRSFDTPIAAPSLYNDPTESYTAGPSPSSSSVYTQQPIPYQLPDISHQEASSANHLEAAQSALGRAPDARTPLYPSRQGAPTSSHPGIGRGAGVCVASHIDHCDGDRGVEDPLPLMTGQRFPNVVQVQGENFLIPRSGHVPSYDKTRTRRMPLSPSLPPNPGMLF